MTHQPETEPPQDPCLRPRKTGLYDPRYEHDACGVGFIAHIKGKRSHQILVDAEEMLRHMDHRGACGSEPNTGDGAGILTALPQVRSGEAGSRCAARRTSLEELGVRRPYVVQGVQENRRDAQRSLRHSPH